MALDPKFKKKWLTALRSGRYKQTTDVLKGNIKDGRKIGYCCLGVAACVLGEKFERDATGYCLAASKCSGGLPASLLDRAGLTAIEAARLVDLNDGSGAQRKHTFKEIADYIEKSL